MKTPIVLSVMQTIGIAALVVHAFREEQPARDAPASPPAAAIAPGAAQIVDEERLRRIVREELAQQHNRPASGHDTSAAQSAPPPRAATAADLQRRDNIAQRIEAYAAMGAISDTQMMELQTDIARLDPASRRQMMSRLVRALNSGDLKGRL
jgi:hypothetical protein